MKQELIHRLLRWQLSQGCAVLASIKVNIIVVYVRVCVQVCPSPKCLQVDTCVHTVRARGQVWVSFRSNCSPYFFSFFYSLLVSYMYITNLSLFHPLFPLLLLPLEPGFIIIDLPPPLMCGSLNKKFLAGTQGSQIQLTFGKRFSARWASMP